MNLIDHRILIPTSPDRVWLFVGDLRRNPQWQVNVQSVSFLTAADKPRPGTRLRVTPNRGREYVVEITAWYDRFGYEYHVVEGLGYRENRGQVRLQEVPEGTIVQWTFNYSGGGLFNRASKQEQQIVEGLRGLYKLIARSKEVETFQAKSLMRDDPGVEARAKYRPRHPSSPNDKTPTPPPLPVVGGPPIIVEPMVLEEDTRPRTGQVAALNEAAVSPIAEPDFLIDEPGTPFTDVPSQPLTPPAPMLAEPAAPLIADAGEVSSDDDALAMSERVIDAPVPAVKPLEDTSPTGTSRPAVVLPPETPELPADLSKAGDAAVELPAFIAPPASVSSEPSEIHPGISERIQVLPTVTRDKLTDTAKISVFDLFGLSKPSETQEIVTLTPEDVAKAVEAEAALSATPPPALVPKLLREYRRYGYRTVSRNRRLKLRRPY